MTNSAKKLIGMSMLAACLSSGAMAQVIPWQLSGAFDDGASLTGGFDYDTASASFSNIFIATGPGNFPFATELLGWTFDNATEVIPDNPNGIQFHYVVPLGEGVEDQHDLFFNGFDPAQPVSANISFIETVVLGLNSPGKPSGIFQSRSGQGFAQPIPEPETYALMLAGLGMAAGLAARRKRKAAIAVGAGKIKPALQEA